MESERRLIDSLNSFVTTESRVLKTNTVQAKIDNTANPLLSVSAGKKESNTDGDTNEVIKTALSNLDRYMNLQKMIYP